jgi:hypothetical protein
LELILFIRVPASESLIIIIRARRAARRPAAAARATGT